MKKQTGEERKTDSRKVKRTEETAAFWVGDASVEGDDGNAVTMLASNDPHLWIFFHVVLSLWTWAGMWLILTNHK